MGFTASGSDGSRWAITAGHCRDVTGDNANWAHGAQNIGPMREATNRSPRSYVDVGRIRIDSSYWRSFSKGWMYNASAPNTPVPVTGAATNFFNEYAVGQTLCLSSWQSIPGNTCGTITDLSGPDLMVQVNFDACAGDSGGGWYIITGPGSRKAMGIHSGGAGTCRASNGWSVFTAIPDANAWWAVTAPSITIRVDVR